MGETAMAAGAAWINGEYVPISEAKIPLLDTGFARSDLTYDVIATWGGKFFRLDDHLDRLERSAEKVRMPLPFGREKMREIAFEMVRRSGLRDAYVQLIVTRGIPVPGERDPRRLTPNFYAYAVPYIWIVKPERQEVGTDIVVARDVRRIPPGAIDPTVKNLQWGDFIRGLYDAYDRDAMLPVLADGDRNITEGPGFNVFLVKDGELFTPARGVLLGITRLTVFDIAAELGIPCHEEDVPSSALYEADEIFLTSTSGGVMPVANLDGVPVGPVQPGPVTRRIKDTYWAWHDDPRFTEVVDYAGG